METCPIFFFISLSKKVPPDLKIHVFFYVQHLLTVHILFDYSLRF
jgi:hypothetical protein